MVVDVDGNDCICCSSNFNIDDGMGFSVRGGRKEEGEEGGGEGAEEM